MMLTKEDGYLHFTDCKESKEMLTFVSQYRVALVVGDKLEIVENANSFVL